MMTVPAGIHCYKNILTRRYLNLDDDGNVYRYNPVNKCYELLLSKAEAIREALGE